jgi:hypothetical protein
MKRILLALILALAIQVAPSSIASEEDSVTSTSVTFGASYPQTGAASLGTRSYYSGINAYFSYVNDNGGVYGRKIGFTLKDDMFVPSLAIAKANEFILTDKIFGFISTAPSCASQFVILQSSRLALRGIPNLFADCNVRQLNQDSDVDPTELSTSTRYNRISYKDESTILKNFIDTNLPSQNILVVYQDDHHGLGISQIASSPRVICSRGFAAGSEGAFLGSQVLTFCGSKSPVNSGDVLVYSGSATGLAVVFTTFERANIKLRYFVNTEAFNTDVFQGLGLPVNSIPEIHFLSSTNLISEVNIASVNSLIAIGQKYAQGTQIDQRFLNGMNTGYIISHVLAAVGPDLTRDRFLQALDLYGSQFDVLGVSNRSTNQISKFAPIGGILVKYADSKTTAISEVFSVDQGRVVSLPRRSGQYSDKGLPVMRQLLPDPTPTPPACDAACVAAKAAADKAAADKVAAAAKAIADKAAADAKAAADKAAADKAAADKAAADKAAADKAAADKAAADKAAADKAAADKAAADKAAADKAAADKAAADKAAADKAAADKAAADLKLKEEAQAAADKLIADAKIAAAKILAAAKAKAAATAKKTTITCIKGKLTKKVTAVNPKCPSGYKKK